MKKAFTLIELLVVIAIIAILAAILFPVFAQAKAAAKKTAAISNQKQINLGIILYTSDYDDVYPRGDGCVLNSSLNTALNGAPAGTDPQTRCQTSNGSFAWRMNHFSWQKWILPYTKNVDLFWHPAKQRFNAPGFLPNTTYWGTFGQIGGSFAINIALTGALNTGDIPNASSGLFRNSWIGGNQQALPNVAGAMILMETANPTTSLFPLAVRNSERTNASYTAFPYALREHLVNDYYAHPGGACPGTIDGAPIDTRAIASEGMAVGFADGHVKFMKIPAIVAATPTIEEYAPGSSIRCGISGSNATISDTVNLNINYPFWGLGG
jgi:prepilin-type N-terminal cleavage/methylation domain-containing protein/prepilin-type processing-associated H-X9-DG protein